jgi:anti-sigma B factor antagonist
MFAITTQTEQSITCIAPEGRLDTVNSSQFDAAVKSLVEKELYLIIDFSKCNYLSSTGIRLLLTAVKKLKVKGGTLLISGISPEIFQVLEMAGLHQIFRFAGSCHEAVEEVNRMKNKGSESSEWADGDSRFQFTPIENISEPALIWNNQGIAGYNELGFSVGTGVTAEAWEEGANSEDLFVTTGSCAGFISADGTSDFRIPHNPLQAGVLVNQSVSFGSLPNGLLRLTQPSSVTLQQLAGSLYKLRSQIKNSQPEMLAMVSVDFNNTAPTVTICLLLDDQMISNIKQRGLQKLSGLALPTGNGIYILGAKFETEGNTKPADKPSLNSFLKEALTLENITDRPFSTTCRSANLGFCFRKVRECTGSPNDD